MNKKQRLEFILLTIFLISGICTIFKVPFSTSMVALSGFFLGSLYFYISYWLFSDFSIHPISRIIAGLLFSVNIVACMFCFLKWPGWQPYCIISYAGLATVAIISLFNKKIPGYKQLLYRSVFFIVFLSIIYGYRKFSA